MRSKSVSLANGLVVSTSYSNLAFVVLISIAYDSFYWTYINSRCNCLEVTASFTGPVDLNIMIFSSFNNQKMLASISINVFISEQIWSTITNQWRLISVWMEINKHIMIQWCLRKSYQQRILLQKTNAIKQPTLGHPVKGSKSLLTHTCREHVTSSHSSQKLVTYEIY